MGGQFLCATCLRSVLIITSSAYAAILVSAKMARRLKKPGQSESPAHLATTHLTAGPTSYARTTRSSPRLFSARFSEKVVSCGSLPAGLAWCSPFHSTTQSIRSNFTFTS